MKVNIKGVQGVYYCTPPKGFKELKGLIVQGSWFSGRNKPNIKFHETQYVVSYWSPKKNEMTIERHLCCDYDDFMGTYCEELHAPEKIVF